MTEIKEFIAFIFELCKHPDFFVLGAMFVAWVVGMVTGIAIQELIQVKHQIRLHQIHGKRRVGR